MHSLINEENVMTGIYKVGGCVRDTAMGLDPHDVDYVVVGSTEQEMLDLGFDKVGSGFPVFIHPTTRCEYALARTEKKTGKGYLEFETYFGPEVTLEQDLERRDFTMNAMAYRNDEIFDPFNGLHDIANGVIRHVNAQAFIEDPVRILRAARFAARYDFIVDSETVALINKISIDDIDAIPRERVMKELEKALKDGKGYQFMKNLYEFNDCMVDLFFGCCFTERLWAIDDLYKQIGFHAVMVYFAEVTGGAIFLRNNKASSDSLFLYRLVITASQRHVLEPSDVYELIMQSDYFRRPKFLEELELYLRITTLNISFIAKQMATVNASDLDPSLKGIEIRDALNKERRKVFDTLVGL